MRRNGITALRAFAATPTAERCDFCGVEVGEGHAHVLDARSGAPRCACPACALLFPERPEAPLRRLQPYAVRLDTVFTDAQWETLGIPVGLAWFFRDAADGRVRVRYPGAAGAVAAPDSTAPEDLARGVPALASLQPGTEALLVHRTASGSACWRVSMDRCWHLAGLLRRHWRGFEGGAEAHAAVDSFLRSLGDDGR